MKIRLEFTRPRTASNFEWVLRLARLQPGYTSAWGGQKLRVHRVDFKDGELGAFMAIYERIAGWKTVAVWIDGALVARAEAFNRILDHHRLARTKGQRIYAELMHQIRRDGTAL